MPIWACQTKNGGGCVALKAAVQRAGGWRGIGAGGNRLHAGGPARQLKYRAGKGAPAGIRRAAKMIGASFFRRFLQLPGDGQTRRRNGARGCWAADLVLDHADLVAGFRKAEHRFDKVRAMGGKHPRGAQNGMGATAGANALFARPFAAAIGIDGQCHIAGRPQPQKPSGYLARTWHPPPAQHRPAGCRFPQKNHGGRHGGGACDAQGREELRRLNA